MIVYNKPHGHQLFPSNLIQLKAAMRSNTYYDIEPIYEDLTYAYTIYQLNQRKIAAPATSALIAAVVTGTGKDPKNALMYTRDVSKYALREQIIVTNG